MEIQAEVAPLDPATQDWILKEADEEKLTVARVRALIRANKTMPTLPLGKYRVVSASVQSYGRAVDSGR